MSRRSARCMDMGIQCRPKQPDAQKRRHCVVRVTSVYMPREALAVRLHLTHSGINRLIALHLAVLAQPVVRLAKGDAWQAVCDQAEVDGAAAAK